jgi:hypothetical protein
VRAGQVVARIDPTERRHACARPSSRPMPPRPRWTSASASSQQPRAGGPGLHLCHGAGHLASQPGRRAATYQAALAAADVARKSLDDTVLRSPISGRWRSAGAARRARGGGYPHAGGGGPVSRLELEALLSPADSLAVRVGQKARLQIEGWPAPVRPRWPASTPVHRPAAARCRCTCAWNRIGIAVLRQGLFVQGLLSTGHAEVLAVPAGCRAHRQARALCAGGSEWPRGTCARQTGRAPWWQGQTLVAIEGVPAGTAVVAGRLGSLREGTAVRCTGCTAAPAAVSAPLPASGPAQ